MMNKITYLEKHKLKNILEKFHLVGTPPYEYKNIKIGDILAMEQITISQYDTIQIFAGETLLGYVPAKHAAMIAAAMDFVYLECVLININPTAPYKIFEVEIVHYHKNEK